VNPTQPRRRRIRVAGLVVVAGLAGLGGTGRGLWTRFRPGRVRVEGLSMAPTLQPGDRLLVLRRSRWRPPGVRVGDIVAVPDPRHPGRVLVKRVKAVTPAGLDLRGDNPALSTDSRTFGPVAAGSVVGRAVYRYGPPGRAGRLPAWP
jgi:nickel-type superoxide dismutase maturation protease